MITEDYVSFETAKLLKEKGFKCDTIHYYYDKDGDLLFSAQRIDVGKNEFVAPTLQMTMKWLREVYNIVLNMNYLFGKWFYLVYRIDVSNSGVNSEDFDTYEEACEVAIKFCLESLI